MRRKGGSESQKAAYKKIILDLIDAVYNSALVPIQDGGHEVDVVFSRKLGRKNEVMSLAESERRLDAAIRAAWRALTGTSIPIGTDPVEFINSKGCR